jgi:prepilin-type N-terminal cleavage/methylation domain-containing protein
MMRHDGMTLIELLATMAIMVLLIAAALPSIRPAVENRRIREAARALDIFINAARNRAMEIGRPAGIMIEPLIIRDDYGKPVSSVSFAMTVDQVEVPPPYCGDSIGAYAKVWLERPDLNAPPILKATLNYCRNIISIGDQVQFNNQGPLYSIIAPDIIGADPTVTLALNTPVLNAPWGAIASNAPYKIYRQPVKSHATPLMLPTGVVIDLESSGTDTGATARLWPYGEFSLIGGSMPSINITFTPKGAVDRVFINHKPYPVSQPIYLMVGKRERVPSQVVQDNAGKYSDLVNYQDQNNLWVTLNPQNGTVTVNYIYVLAPPQFMNTTIIQSREYARNSFNLGGR